MSLFPFLKKIGPGKDQVQIGTGFSIRKVSSNLVSPIAIQDNQRFNHWLTVGTTGSGKTRLLEHIVAHDIRQNYSVAVFDPKPDQGLFARIIWEAHRAGRLQDIIIVRPDMPEISARVNPFAFFSQPEELVQHVMAGIPPNTEEFFRKIAYEVSLCAILGKWILSQYAGQEFSLTVEELWEAISRQKLVNLFEQIRSLPENAAGNYQKTVTTALEALIASPQDYFAKVTSTLRTVLTAISLGALGEIVGHTQENAFVERIIQGKPFILIVQVPSLVMRDAGLSLQRMILSMLQNLAGNVYIGRIPELKSRFDPPLMIHVDELSEALYWDFITFLNKVRGCGVGIHALTQSVADLTDIVKRENARRLLDNFNTQLFFRVNDPETSRYVASKAGSRKVFTRIFAGGAFSGREMREPVLDTASALELPDRVFYLFTQSNGKHSSYRGRTVNVSNVPLMVKYSPSKHS